MGTGNVDIEQVRATAIALAERIKSDAAFRTEVEANPTGTLTAAGLPGQAVEEFMVEVSEVAGYRPPVCDSTCYILTCLVTHA